MTKTSYRNLARGKNSNQKGHPWARNACKIPGVLWGDGYSSMRYSHDLWDVGVWRELSSGSFCCRLFSMYFSSHFCIFLFICLIKWYCRQSIACLLQNPVFFEILLSRRRCMIQVLQCMWQRMSVVQTEMLYRHFR